MRVRLVVSSIGSRDVAWAQRSPVGHREDALQPLDFVNGPFGVHRVQSSSARREWVKRKWYGVVAEFVTFVLPGGRRAELTKHLAWSGMGSSRSVPRSTATGVLLKDFSPEGSCAHRHS
jgi:hypothetical protein